MIGQKLKTAPPPGSHVIQLTGTIFELYSNIKETNALTKFHENWAKNVTSRVEKCPAHWRPYINKTNVLTNVYDDWAKIVTSRVFTRKTAPPGSHVIELTGTIFELYSHIKEPNKNAPPTGGLVFSPIWTNFELFRDINKTNVLTNFHYDWAKIVTSRVFTRKTAPPTGGHVFQRTGTTFELNQHIIKTNILTKLHEDWAKNVTSTVLTISNSTEISLGHIKETNVLTKFHENWTKNVTSRKNAPPTGGHVFSPIWTIFKVVLDINKTNVLTNFYDDWAKVVTSRVFTCHVIELTGTIFELNSHIKETNVLIKMHENWAKNVTSRVFTCFHYIHIEKNAPPTGGLVFSKPMKTAPPTGGHVFSPIWTIFKVVLDINKTNVLTNFHDDWAKIPTSRVKTAPPTGGHVFQWTGTTFELNQHMIKTNILTNFKLDRDFIGKKLLTKFHEDRTIIVASRVFTNKCGRTDGRRDVRRTKTGQKSSPEQSG
ncbi:hypothetical protein DPMN_049592 [Dreissena polymorpha]|uniref:Uncharacterized protein n=1 Tax=Dreissena polymorpha TaxID=45954 RepID=A0A9D4CEL8_DREPO|nr:hypothetical protein DPMN_049592 [Dreissena polymorpha]